MARRIVNKPILSVAASQEAPDELHVTDQDERPKNMPANKLPIEGFSLEVDGKLKSQHATQAAAMKAGAELKGKFPVLQVKVYDAAARTYSMVEASK